ncbi:hypothetical protein H9Q13_10420 [Pontibacter sp. JH31]|uniref:Secreted protein n=1 Tax=Pontibacter aquaedesilientis TaxID=2766980 RepID=A0ABR7XH46_9BACT|nr:hypothetical protein [Pontibacter aquaedesilientis]MBD1397581.1 hypothetical protein [Pontibacter aquaedesilientis]
MKTTVSFFLVAALVGFASCSDDNTQSDTTNTQSTNAPASMNAATAAPAGDVALNPAHGEPGHNCAIPVGAPLNSTPQPKLTTPPPVFQPQATGSVAEGTNPPHGQPGHDCAIPVGAPLPK